MSDKLTPKQEKFAQKYVELGNASDAYREAYDVGGCTPKSINEMACTALSNNIKIISRVDEIRKELAERNKVTVDSISKQLEDIIQLATTAQQYSPAVTGIMGKAKLHGFLVEKQQQVGSVTIKVADPNDLEL